MYLCRVHTNNNFICSKITQTTEQIDDMIKLFVSAVDQNRPEDLKKLGLNIKTYTARETIDKNILNERVYESVIGGTMSFFFLNQ
jgi:hypothetical protein